MRVLFRHKGGRKERMQRRYADVLQKLGRGTYMTRDMRATVEPDPAAEELARLRAQYQQVLGRRPYHGWDADELRQRIIEAE